MDAFEEMLAQDGPLTLADALRAHLVSRVGVAGLRHLRARSNLRHDARRGPDPYRWATREVCAMCQTPVLVVDGQMVEHGWLHVCRWECRPCGAAVDDLAAHSCPAPAVPAAPVVALEPPSSPPPPVLAPRRALPVRPHGRIVSTA